MLVTTAKLLDYLGADKDSESIVESCRMGAIAYLRGATGRPWPEDCNEKDVALANEIIKARVWLAFHTLRGGEGNTAFIVQHVTALVKLLQYPVGDSHV